MSGKLYGIGVGPGDPELLTLKAIKTLEKCDIIAVPKTSDADGEKTAFAIVKGYLEGKATVECLFSMERDEAKRKAMRLKVAEDICKLLDDGKNIGFITLGDPTIYSTYMYVHKIVAEKGYETEIIPGIPSFVAAAAALNISLCEGNETLHIIPASNGENVDKIRELKGNKVIMKSGKSMSEVLEILKKSVADVKIVARCTMTDEKIYNGIEEYERAQNPEYFSVIVAKEQ